MAKILSASVAMSCLRTWLLLPKQNTPVDTLALQQETNRANGFLHPINASGGWSLNQRPQEWLT